MCVVCRLRFGKVVDKVIPYLPMDPASIVLVIELKLEMLAETLPGGLYTTPGGFRNGPWCMGWEGACVFHTSLSFFVFKP